MEESKKTDRDWKSLRVVKEDGDAGNSSTTLDA